jgi:protoheme IX farnesyltransferase
MEPKVALYFGLALAALGLPALTFGVGPMAGLFAALALVSYVLFYTPLKRHSAAALLVGAVPGAIPPLLGWAAATGDIALPGFLLFAVMFLWQVPHFLAIAIFRKDEYAGAGLIVQPNQLGGERAARVNTVRYTVALWPISLLFVPLGTAGAIYFWTALVAGLLFVTAALAGLRRAAGVKWARGLFVLSLFYVTVVFGVLMFDRPASPAVSLPALGQIAISSALLVFSTEIAILVYKLRGPPGPERPGPSRLLWAFVPAATLAGLCVWCALVIIP